MSIFLFLPVNISQDIGVEWSHENHAMSIFTILRLSHLAFCVVILPALHISIYVFYFFLFLNLLSP